MQKPNRTMLHFINISVSFPENLRSTFLRSIFDQNSECPASGPSEGMGRVSGFACKWLLPGGKAVSWKRSLRSGSTRIWPSFFLLASGKFPPALTGPMYSPAPSWQGPNNIRNFFDPSASLFEIGNGVYQERLLVFRRIENSPWVFLKPFLSGLLPWAWWASMDHRWSSCIRLVPFHSPVGIFGFDFVCRRFLISATFMPGEDGTCSNHLGREY